MHFYVTQLHAGDWYVCETTTEEQRGIRVPFDLTSPWPTRAVAEAARFVANHRLAALLYACKHGHRQCSVYQGGRCLDETLIEFPSLGGVGL